MANNEKQKEYIESLNSDIQTATNVKLTQAEREFFLNYNELDKVWVAESSIPKFWRKLEKKNWTCVKVQYYPDGTVCSKTFTSNCAKGISITDPTIKRKMSDAQRQASKERLLKLQANKKLSNKTEENEK